MRALEVKSKSISAKDTTASSAVSGTKRNTVHLPKLQLPIFSGDVFKFREFYEIFEASI